ncbi:MAG: putative rane protein [Thermotogaceae bacterium]|nr:putative rane protein [Thermotogaceae bacterium]
MNYLWIFFNGILMGTANVIPGLSGGTLLLLTGIYPRFIDVFGSINPKSLRDYKWKENIVFIMIIAVGALLSIFAMSRIMSWLLESYDVPVYLLLIGLIIGSIDVITKKIDFKVNSSRITFVTGILMIVLLVIATRFFRTSTPAQGDVNLIILLTAGAIAAATMVLPGVSGSMLLLLLGLYKPVVDSVSALNIINVFFIAIGAIVGILFASRLIKYLLDKHSSSTYAFLLGLILASIVDLFPFSIFQTFNAFVIGIIALIFGIILGKGLKRLEKNYSEEKL